MTVTELPIAMVFETVDTETGTSVIVKCPFCKGRHCHGYDGAKDDGIRASHCHSGEYRFVTPAPVNNQAHVLYRFYSATGQLLYVGITMNPPKRFKNHRDGKEWWSAVSGITVETYNTRDELEKAERRAIQVERPLHNIAHNDAGQRKLSATPKPQPPPKRVHDQRNPLGLSDYNIAQFAKLPQWQKLSQALNHVALAANDAGLKGGQDTLVEAVMHLARGIGYMDCCPKCERGLWESTDEGDWIDTSCAPYRTQIHGGSVCGHYRCAQGHEWFCWYSLRLPELMF
jgi:predicted GIY-YIG superfamily endonuclease